LYVGDDCLFCHRECFLGVGVPSADGDVSYNRFLSVNHPVFVHNYAKFIVPDLPNGTQQAMKQFLVSHKAIFEKDPSCAAALQIANS